MRISTNQFHSQGINSIQNHQAKVLETQLQLSTGKRVNAASDDFAAKRMDASIQKAFTGKHLDQLED